MDPQTVERILTSILPVLEIQRSLPDLRGIAADFETVPDPTDRIMRCIDRLGAVARISNQQPSSVLTAADSRRSYLLVGESIGLGASYLLTADGITRIPNGESSEVVARIGRDEFLTESQLIADKPIPVLQFEKRPTLALARSVSADDHSMSPFRRLRGLLAPDARDIYIVILFAIGVGILSLATPIAVQSLVNFVAFGGLVQPLFIIGILLFAFLAMAGVIRTYKAYIVDVLQRRIFVRVVGDLAYRLPRVRIEAFDTRSGPELVNRFFDVMTVQKASATFLLDGVGVLLQAFIGLVILAFYHPFLLAFDVVLIGAILFVVFVLGRGAVKTAILESKAKYAVAASLEEIALNPLTFKQAGGNEFAWHRTDALAAEYVRARRSHFNVVVRQIIGAVALQAIAGTALLTLGGFLVIQGELTLGQLVASELIVSIVLASFSKFGKQLESIYDLLAGVDKLGHLIDLPLERQDGECLPASSQAGAVSLIDVDFGYDGRSAIFERLSLQIAAGERVLIVGDHGSGKSTLSDLFCGARSPIAGRVELDNLDFRDLSLDAIRRHVAVVKGLEIVEGSIVDNVRLDRTDVSRQDIRRALEDVGLSEALRKLPEGLDTQLNNQGRPLSYGQARRLMVARAIAGAPRVVVLDNLLDDLDAHSREIIVRTILDADRPWTVIITSHQTHELPGLSRVIELPTARRSTEAA
ncbi:MAG: ATP-binding cassette domain-containing protein [Phycisphaerales bacterium]|nr:ATP-binding cassette domain-containing protein [Phycisphaerales bacterium]MCB9857195.1 ATP-binding cassette domain-containing protein [Phycisphaerales bacterium]MCB9863092.1 ATP-binding cassette domain-containing protein [Phycisphaerales bacterium]